MRLKKGRHQSNIKQINKLSSRQTPHCLVNLTPAKNAENNSPFYT